MLNITKFLIFSKCLPIVCLFVVYCESSYPAVPYIYPEEYADDGKPYMEFDCEAYVQKGDWLAWTTVEGAVDEELTLKKNTEKDGNITTKLLRPLQDEDNVTWLYCAVQTKDDQGYWYSGESKNVSIVFYTVKKPIANILGPWVWPNTTVVEYNQPTTVSFTCWSYLFISNMLSWYQVTASNKTERIAMMPQRHKWGYVTFDFKKTLEPSDNGTQIFCANESLSDGFAWKESETGRITFRYNKPEEQTLVNVSKVWVIPSSYSEDGRSLLEFTCHAYLNETDLLSWFHVNALNTTKRLDTIQQDQSFGYKNLTLIKALEPLDNETEIYCAKEIILSGNLSTVESDRIPIRFRRDKLYVTVTPNSVVVLFENSTILHFVCSGSYPLSNRTYSWYLQGPHFQQHKVQGQHYHKSTNLNRLDLHMNESYHQSQLYCAQDYKMSLKDSRKCDCRTVSYGEVARSHTITLLHQGIGDLEENPQLSPRNYIDNRRHHIEITCFAYARPGEVLSWYQFKGTHKSERPLLRVDVLESPTDEKGQWIWLTLNKTLDHSDDGSDIYCSKQSVRPDGKYSRGFNSQVISISFSQDIEYLDKHFLSE